MKAAFFSHEEPLLQRPRPESSLQYFVQRLLLLSNSNKVTKKVNCIFSAKPPRSSVSVIFAVRGETDALQSNKHFQLHQKSERDEVAKTFSDVLLHSKVFFANTTHDDDDYH